MPEPRSPNQVQRWREYRRGLARRAGRHWIAALVCVVITLPALAASSLYPPRPRLVWNASLSSPVGLYWVALPRDIEAGDRVIAWMPASARQLGAERHYLPSNLPLVKRVAAVGGDQVCASGSAIFVNGRLQAQRRARDGGGRPMPWWIGCEQLRRGDLFLLNPGVPASFDGRYFGITRAPDVVGSARLLWAR